MFAKFSPDGSRVAYVRANNIYVEDIASGTITPLTHDGSDTIVNGTSDWVYEEELDVRDGFQWSPDGNQIAYWQFDTSGVGNFKLIYDHGTPKEIVTGFLIPASACIPRCSIFHSDSGNEEFCGARGHGDRGRRRTRWMEVPGDPRENYIARMEWAVEQGSKGSRSNI